MEKELEILRKNDIEFQDKISSAIKTIKEIKQNREVLKKQWEESNVSAHGKRLLNLQLSQHCSIIDKIVLELNEYDEDWMRKMSQLKEMDEQIYIRDKLIKVASSKLQSLKISSLLKNSLLVKDPYGM